LTEAFRLGIGSEIADIQTLAATFERALRIVARYSA
jgi:hypothetical protein